MRKLYPFPMFLLMLMPQHQGDHLTKEHMLRYYPDRCVGDTVISEEPAGDLGVFSEGVRSFSIASRDALERAPAWLHYTRLPV